MIDWRHWHNEPFLVGGLVLVGWLWAVLAGPMRERIAPGARFPRAHAWRFYAGLVIFYLAVGSPLDQIGERFLFSVHMLQHFILVYAVPVLVLTGVPSWMADRALAPLAGNRAARVLTHPAVCLVTYTLVVSLWHMPLLYDWALRVKTVHVIEHLMFFAAALFYWWPMCSPSLVFRAASRPGQMIYFFCGVIMMTPLFAYVTFSHDLLYPTYEYAPRIISGFSAADDQLLAGVGMQLVSVWVAICAFGVAFYNWHRDQAKRDEAAAAAKSASA